MSDAIHIRAINSPAHNPSTLCGRMVYPHEEAQTWSPTQAQIRGARMVKIAGLDGEADCPTCMQIQRSAAMTQGRVRRW